MLLLLAECNVVLSLLGPGCTKIPRQICTPHKPACRKVPHQDCKPTTERKCHAVPKPHCTTVERKVPRQECGSVEKEHCQYFPEQICETITEQKCLPVSRERCEQIPQTHCVGKDYPVCGDFILLIIGRCSPGEVRLYSHGAL